jgi:cytidylate kinase
MRINIAIDGPSAAGKSTIAKRLAEILNYIHLDTGAMYRCIAYKAQALNIDTDDEEGIKAFLPSTDIDFDSQGHIFLDGNDVTSALRAENMAWLASSVSTLLSVREDLVRRQKAFADSKGIIMDGRDIGTVVLPNAEVKIFLTADVDSRASRRYLDQVKIDPEVKLEDIRQDIIKRDIQDTTRIHSPLLKAADAIELDTTNMSINEVIDKIVDIIKMKGQVTV